MPSVDYIKTNPDFVEESKDLLLDQFQGSTNLIKILEIGLQGEVSLEQLLVDMADSWTLDNAIGEQLDEIGRQVGVARTTEDDEQYRAFIRLAGRRRIHKIDKESVLELLRLITGDQELQLYNGLNHVVEITVIRECFDSNISDGNKILELMPTNTNLRILGSNEVLFGFDNSTIAKGGFSSVANREVGGGFASIRFRTDTSGK